MSFPGTLLPAGARVHAGSDPCPKVPSSPDTLPAHPPNSLLQGAGGTWRPGGTGGTWLEQAKCAESLSKPPWGLKAGVGEPCMELPPSEEGAISPG